MAESQAGVPQQLFSKDKKTNQVIERQFFKNKMQTERNKLSALLHNFQPGYLEPEFEGDQTLKVTQSQILQAVNVQTASNVFQLRLNMGSYRCKYSSNGSTLLLASSLGHLSLVSWREKQAKLQINLQQNIMDATFLHDTDMFALSQQSGTYIYDNRGIELHKLDRSLGLEYLPYHFLLVGYDCRKLKYYDTTTGQIIADHIARNPYSVMRQNKSNGIIALGSAKGVVEWWTPGVGTPAVKMFAGSQVDDVGFYKGYMYTVSDTLKVWDTRMLTVLHEKKLNRKVKSMAVSQSGIVGLNYGFKMEMFKDFHLEKQNLPYMKYQNQGSQISNNAQFVPFEDLLGIGTSDGFNCIVVPGSGVPFYDTFECNPFETKKQKREALVHKLLEKLPAETITVDPNILGNISKISKEVLEADQREQQAKKDRQRIEKLKEKNRMKGKNKISRKINRKNIELDKIKRAELTKHINTKLWARWAEKKKKQSEIQLIQEIESQGFGLSELLANCSKTKKITKFDDN